MFRLRTRRRATVSVAIYFVVYPKLVVPRPFSPFKFWSVADDHLFVRKHRFASLNGKYPPAPAMQIRGQKVSLICGINLGDHSHLALY